MRHNIGCWFFFIRTPPKRESRKNNRTSLPIAKRLEVRRQSTYTNSACGLAHSSFSSSTQTIYFSFFKKKSCPLIPLSLRHCHVFGVQQASESFCSYPTSLFILKLFSHTRNAHTFYWGTASSAPPSPSVGHIYIL